MLDHESGASMKSARKNANVELDACSNNNVEVEDYPGAGISGEERMIVCPRNVARN